MKITPTHSRHIKYNYNVPKYSKVTPFENKIQPSSSYDKFKTFMSEALAFLGIASIPTASYFVCSKISKNINNTERF